MPSVTVHYDGWLQLPERMRKALGLDTGARLEADLVDGGLLLRGASVVTREETQQAPPVPVVSAEAHASPACRRGPSHIRAGRRVRQRGANTEEAIAATWQAAKRQGGSELGGPELF